MAACQSGTPPWHSTSKQVTTSTESLAIGNSATEARNSRWNRATTEQGVTTLELHLDLAATNVLTIQCPGDFRSQAAMGIGADIRPVAVAFRLDSWSIVPRE
jgi:hypothetical protein